MEALCETLEALLQGGFLDNLSDGDRMLYAAALAASIVVLMLLEEEEAEGAARARPAAGGAGGGSAAGAGGPAVGAASVFWLDIFSHPQLGKAIERPTSWWTGCFRDTMRRIGHTLLVLEWEDPQPLKRAWCVWEMASSVGEGRKLEVVMSPRESARFEEALLVNDNFDSLVKRLCVVNLARAKSSHESDRESILAAVEGTVGSGGGGGRERAGDGLADLRGVGREGGAKVGRGRVEVFGDAA
jgi:hypothetical protein